MEVIGYDPYLSVDAAWNLSRSAKKAADLSDIFANCDYITLHLPLNDFHSLHAEHGAVWTDEAGRTHLNFSRGEFVDTDALRQAIADGIVAKYVVDFPNEDTLKMDNVIAIPHLGASTKESGGQLRGNGGAGAGRLFGKRQYYKLGQPAELLHGP